MSGKNLTHEEINQLLPWYLNGTLESEEKEIVKKHLAGCSLCAMEMEELEMLRNSIVEANESQNEMMSVPAERMEQNIMEMIDSYEGSAGSKATQASRAESMSIWSRVSEFIDSISVPSLSPVAMAALFIIQFAIILGLAGTLFFSEPEYEVLSGKMETAEINGPTILISFQDTTTEKEIRELLINIDGKIIDGPKSGGMYIVELPQEMASEKSMDNLMENISSNTDVVKNVFRGSR